MLQFLDLPLVGDEPSGCHCDPGSFPKHANTPRGDVALVAAVRGGAALLLVAARRSGGALLVAAHRCGDGEVFGMLAYYLLPD